MYQSYNGFKGNNLNIEMSQFMSNIFREANKFSDNLLETKIEVQKIKKYLNDLSDTNQIDNAEQFSTKSDIINEIIQSSDNIDKLNSNKNNQNKETLNETQKIKDILDYIIAIDKEIEKNRNSK